MTPSQPRNAARRLARSSRSTCSMVRRSAAPSSAHRCAFLGSSGAANRTESESETRSSRGRHKRQPRRRNKTTRHVGKHNIPGETEWHGDREGAAAAARHPGRTCAAGGAPDGVPAGEEDLNDPRPDEAAGAGDAHDDGHRALTPGSSLSLSLCRGTGERRCRWVLRLRTDGRME